MISCFFFFGSAVVAWIFGREKRAREGRKAGRKNSERRKVEREDGVKRHTKKKKRNGKNKEKRKVKMGK